MTNIGILRKVDSLGRVTIPKELRQVFGFKKGSSLEILATEQGVLIRNPAIEVRRVDKHEGLVID